MLANPRDALGGFYYVRSLGDAHDPARIQEARDHGHDHDDDHGGDHAEDGDH